MVWILLRRVDQGSIFFLVFLLLSTTNQRTLGDAVDSSIFPNTSTCHDKSGTDSLIELNSTDSTNVSSLEDCTDLAAAYHPHQDVRCQSACWSKTTLQCHCHLAPIWMPLEDANVDSAILNWPCISAKDCSYNGICLDSGACRCDAAWGGVRCGQLQLLPVDKKTMGFREKDPQNNANISTWGAPILWDETTQKWHGWASEMIHGCGINAWTSNSQIVHITSDSPYGPFERQGVFAKPFAHEPSVKRAPNGDWVMLYSAYNDITQQYSKNHKGYDQGDDANKEWTKVVCTNCSQGASLSPEGSKGCPFQRGRPQELAHPFLQMMARAPTPNGPWDFSTEIPPLSMPWDWNTALTINPDDSAVALIRGGMVWHADHYADPTTWHPANAGGRSGGQSPPWSIGVEDPFIWKDAQGIYHALAHCFNPFYGVHAFVHPTHVPKNWNAYFMNWTVTGVAYGNGVNFTDGTSFAFSRRERPQLIFDKNDGVTPVALSNGVAYGKSPYKVGEDYVTTLVQAIQQSGFGVDQEDPVATGKESS